jgi:hypothetical protein
MPRKRAKTPKMSESDIAKVLSELDAWCRGERPGKLGWKNLEEFSGFTRQALSDHDEIAERFGQAKVINRPKDGITKKPPKSTDQRIIDLQREIESLRGIINRYDERGIDLVVLAEQMDPPARGNVTTHGGKARARFRRAPRLSR